MSKQLEIYYDPLSKKLTILFEKNYEGLVHERQQDDFILIKRSSGEVIGFEKLNYEVEDTRNFLFSFELSK